MIEIKGRHGKSVVFETLMSNATSVGLIVNEQFPTPHDRVYRLDDTQITATTLETAIITALHESKFRVRTLILYTNIDDPVLLRNCFRRFIVLEHRTMITIIFMYRGDPLK